MLPFDVAFSSVVFVDLITYWLSVAVKLESFNDVVVKFIQLIVVVVGTKVVLMVVLVDSDVEIVEVVPTTGVEANVD